MSLTRRSFLRNSGAGLAGAALGLPGCSARDRRGSGDPVVVDTHTHFYDPSRPEGVPWPRKEEKRLYRKVMPEDYRALPVPQPVAGTVVVEASPWVEDNRWILDLADRTPFIVGFVGNLEPGAAGFEAHLERFAANRLFRGIRARGKDLRQGAEWPAVVAGVKRLAARDLSLDVNVPFAALPDVERLAKEVPDLRIVVNHMAGARIDGKTVDGNWRRQVQALARQPKVFMKVSGLVEGSGRRDGTAPRDLPFYRPWLDAVWEAFGEDRLVYGSNWPVSELFADLSTVQSLIAEYFAGRGGAALEKVFAGNARAAYKWIDR